MVVVVVVAGKTPLNKVGVAVAEVMVAVVALDLDVCSRCRVVATRVPLRKVSATDNGSSNGCMRV